MRKSHFPSRQRSARVCWPCDWLCVHVLRCLLLNAITAGCMCKSMTTLLSHTMSQLKDRRRGDGLTTSLRRLSSKGAFCYRSRYVKTDYNVWLRTCCRDETNHAEAAEVITPMFDRHHDANRQNFPNFEAPQRMPDVRGVETSRCLTH